MQRTESRSQNPQKYASQWQEAEYWAESLGFAAGAAAPSEAQARSQPKRSEPKHELSSALNKQTIYIYTHTHVFMKIIVCQLVGQYQLKNKMHATAFHKCTCQEEQLKLEGMHSSKAGVISLATFRRLGSSRPELGVMGLWV